MASNLLALGSCQLLSETTSGTPNLTQRRKNTVAVAELDALPIPQEFRQRSMTDAANSTPRFQQLQKLLKAEQQ